MTGKVFPWTPVYFTEREGDIWHSADKPLSIHAIRFANEIEWDVVNGFRSVVNSPMTYGRWALMSREEKEPYLDFLRFALYESETVPEKRPQELAEIMNQLDGEIKERFDEESYAAGYKDGLNDHDH